jgi:hypothetical protein
MIEKAVAGKKDTLPRQIIRKTPRKNSRKLERVWLKASIHLRKEKAN